MTPASSTEPTVGASVWASGSHVWKGHIGTLMANPRNSPRKIRFCTDRAAVPTPEEAELSRTMSNVWPTPGTFDRKYSARKPRSMNTEPNSVYRKNLIEAYWRFAEPHTAIRKYIGTSTSSQKMKNTTRTNAM